MDLIFTVFLCLIPILILHITTRRRRWPSKKLPPGSLGFPMIGQTLSFLRAMGADKIRAWFEDRAERYGPVSKLCILGQPTVFIYGQAANKFVFTGGLCASPPESFTKLIGRRNIFELSGEDHKRIRETLMVFLKPESLKNYVGKMDEEVRRHIQMHWQGNTNITVLPLMKTLTFDVINSLVFGIGRGTRSDELTHLFETLVRGVLSIPVNIPFSNFNRSLRARARIRDILREVIQEKRVELQEKSRSSRQDLITCLLNEKVIPEDEVLDNVILVMLAGYETSATLVTFIIRQLARYPTLLARVLEEQEGIAKYKSKGELLTWGDLTKMKYTWKVALETLRMFPPVFPVFRKALTDIEYGGYIIPQGWQVLSVMNMTHMEDSIFEEASKFDPERFDNQAATGRIPSFCFVPFGGGHRLCPGNEFARIETLVTIHYLVTRFTWKLSSKDTTVSYAPAPVPAEGLPIEISPRTTADDNLSW